MPAGTGYSLLNDTIEQSFILMGGNLRVAVDPWGASRVPWPSYL